jgi:predicted dehydrogenase
LVVTDGQGKVRVAQLDSLIMKQLRIAVIGAGAIAEKHLEVLSAFDDVEIVALCNSGNPRIQALADRFGIKNTFFDYRRVLDTVKIDAVFVLVSVLRIPEVTRECLQRGIPTLIEKPPGLSADETRSLVKAATETNCLNMVALNRRFYSVMQRAREAILDAGPLVSIVIEAPERLADYHALGHPPEVIRRLLFANGIHTIDLLRFFGGDVREVNTLSGSWFADQKDSFGALVRFQTGGSGSYISHWTSPGRWSVNLYGKGRRVTLRPLEQGTVIEADGAERALATDQVDELYKPGIYAQDRYFLDCIKNGRRPAYPASDLADALKTMELIEQIQGGESE